MPFDLLISKEVHDLQLSGNRDLSITDGNDLVNQRIITRLNIERGSFIYDQTGSLGSSIKTVLHGMLSGDEQVQATEQLIREALQPMEDIYITDVLVQQVQISDDTQRIELQAVVKWAPVIVGGGSDTPLISGEVNSLPITI